MNFIAALALQGDQADGMRLQGACVVLFAVGLVLLVLGVIAMIKDGPCEHRCNHR